MMATKKFSVHSQSTMGRSITIEFVRVHSFFDSFLHYLMNWEITSIGWITYNSVHCKTVSRQTYPFIPTESFSTSFSVFTTSCLSITSRIKLAIPLDSTDAITSEVISSIWSISALQRNDLWYPGNRAILRALNISTIFFVMRLLKELEAREIFIAPRLCPILCNLTLLPPMKNKSYKPCMQYIQ